ncbi:MAG: TetR/AcrR family transcriptional regulator [Methanospirillum sp.]|nr:TetR/AcrR family transcriptional regulator [Methanospirillum sp.]
MPRINAEYRKMAKKKIINAAIEVAVENGWDAVTLEAIAKRMNISKGTLYVYFENGDALHREVIYEVFRRLKINLVSVCRKSEDIHQVVREIAELIFEQQRPYTAIFCQIPSQIPHDGEHRSDFIRLYDQNAGVIRDFLQEMKIKGNISPHIDADSAADIILALTIGLRIKTLFLGRDSHIAKLMWIQTIERILLIEPAYDG